MAFVGNGLETFARARPEAIALKSGATKWTWRCLMNEIGAAEDYICRTTSRGGRVALMLEDPAALLICFFACARTARIAMVLDPGWPDDQKSGVLTAAGPDLLIDDHTFSKRCRPQSMGAAVHKPAGMAP